MKRIPILILATIILNACALSTKNIVKNVPLNTSPLSQIKLNWSSDWQGYFLLQDPTKVQGERWVTFYVEKNTKLAMVASTLRPDRELGGNWLMTRPLTGLDQPLGHSGRDAVYVDSKNRVFISVTVRTCQLFWPAIPITPGKKSCVDTNCGQMYKATPFNNTPSHFTGNCGLLGL